MNLPPLPEKEEDRLQALIKYQVLDTQEEAAFDNLTALAAKICHTPIALISLVDKNRQWFKSKFGLEATETPRELAFCAHAICQTQDVFIVPNAEEDERFADNPLVVSEPNVIFYAGVPLVTPDGFAIGTLCVIYHKPRNISLERIQYLQTLSIQIISQLEARVNLINLKQNIIHRQIVEKHLRYKNKELADNLGKLNKSQIQLIQSEKMLSLEEMVAGIAHEINNPVNFIYANLKHVGAYVHDLLDLLSLYKQEYPDSNLEIQNKAEEIDSDFLTEDIPSILSSMDVGAKRIKNLVLSLRNFARLDEAETKLVDIHEGIDNTILLLQHRLDTTLKHFEIKIIREYGEIPQVECYAAQINQVFFGILSNAIDALEEKFNSEQKSIQSENNNIIFPAIRIITEISCKNNLLIKIADNGIGIPREFDSRVFDPFFTSKPVGKGQGLGLSISYQIITNKHNGTLKYRTKPGEGTEFWIEIPIKSN